MLGLSAALDGTLVRKSGPGTLVAQCNELREVSYDGATSHGWAGPRRGSGRGRGGADDDYHDVARWLRRGGLVRLADLPDGRAGHPTARCDGSRAYEGHADEAGRQARPVAARWRGTNG